MMAGAPKGNRNAAGKRVRSTTTMPWPLQLSQGARTHGGTTALNEVPTLPRRVADPEAEAPLQELTTPILPPAVADVFRDLRDELAGSLGGAENLSAQQGLLIDATAHTALQLAYVDRWIASKPTFINARSSTLLPIVLHRQRIAKALVNQLSLLGLERIAKDVDTLDAYLARRAAASPSAGPDHEVVEQAP